MIIAEALERKIVVWDIAQAKKLHEKRYFGKFIKEDNVEYLLLSLTEAMYLLEKGTISIKSPTGSFYDVASFYEYCVSLDKEFPQKYVVFRDLRNRGYVVKSGFKFGTHFRVYDKGVNPYKEGEKSKKEHTKYNVHCVMENQTLSYQEWSRYVRLSQNIRAQALLAVVDEEQDVTYYTISRVKL